MAAVHENYEHLCRLCASKTNTAGGLNIFDGQGSAREIYKKISTCLPVQVLEADRLPKMICCECASKLELFFNFRAQCLETEGLLLELAKSLERTKPKDPGMEAMLDGEVADDMALIQELGEKLQLPESAMAQLVQQNMHMSQHPLTVQNLEMMHQQHNLLPEPFQEPHATIPPIVALKRPRDLMPQPTSDKDAPGEEGVDACDSSWHYCSVCGKTLAVGGKISHHYEKHVKCRNCEAIYTNADTFDAHHQPKTSADEITIKDEESELSEDNGDEAKLEQEEAMEEEEEEEEEVEEETQERGKRKRWVPKVCKECGKSYKTNYKLTEHMRKHTGEQPYKCGTCGKGFRSKIGMAQHEAKHTGNYELSCPTCGKGFQCKSYLIVHQRVHSNVKPYPCDTCGRNFKTKQSQMDHMNRHLGLKPYVCQTCGRSFITKGLCKSHQKVHSGTDNRQFPCSVCNKMFVSKSYLATHVRIHTGEKPFMCEVCGKGFLTRVDLRIHSTMHTGEKSFVCEMCGKAFARRDALRCHRRSHTGERPYRCDVCGQTFTQFSPMAIHKRLHTGERPYECELCKKTFVSRSTMTSHRKKHFP